jgi:hypothetical protein
MNLLAWIFFGPAKLIVQWPLAGFVIGAVLIASEVWMYRRHEKAFSNAFFREAPVFAGLLWAIFNVYEWQIAATSLATSTLRIDLLVLVPVLYAMSVMAIIVLKKQWPSKTNAG